MPTLLQINTFVNSRSTGRIAEEIGKLVLLKGWKSYIAYGRDEQPSESIKIPIGNSWDIACHGLETRLFDRHGLGSVKATKKFIKQIDKIAPDIIHLHNMHGYYLNYEILFDYLSHLEVPVVWTLHDCWAYTGHCTHYDLTQCYKWKKGCGKCPQLGCYPKGFLDRSSLNWLDKKKAFTSVPRLTLVPVSEWLSQEVSHSFLQNISRKIICNGVDLDVFKPRPFAKHKENWKGRFVILGVANVWEKKKGFDDYITLSQKIASDCIIVLVGVNAAQKKELSANMIGIERTESLTRLAELYSAADVCLNISYEETFGMTTIEAFACGTPGIVYRATASPELITPETGVIVEKGNIDQLVNAIYEVKRKGKSYYSKACRERAEKYYDKNKCFMQYVSLYENLIACI